LIDKQAILFDLDGTLLDTLDMILTSFRHATKTVLGEAVEDSRARALIGMPLLDQMRIIDAEHAEELVETYRAHNHVIHDEMIRYFEGTREALEELARQGWRLAVVTSKRNVLAERGLDCFNLRPSFELLIGSDDTARHKPDPAPLLYAAKRLGLPIESCVYVGDSPYDMQAARAAGAVAVAALWGMFPRETLIQAGAQYEAASISNLPELLVNLEVVGGDGL
jgi:pyrophosphatase PpaX